MTGTIVGLDAYPHARLESIKITVPLRIIEMVGIGAVPLEFDRFDSYTVVNATAPQAKAIAGVNVVKATLAEIDAAWTSMLAVKPTAIPKIDEQIAGLSDDAISLARLTDEKAAWELVVDGNKEQFGFLTVEIPGGANMPWTTSIGAKDLRLMGSKGAESKLLKYIPVVTS